MKHKAEQKIEHADAQEPELKAKEHDDTAAVLYDVRHALHGRSQVASDDMRRPGQGSSPAGEDGWQQGRSSDNVCGEQEGEEEESDSEYRVGVGYG